ncbi:MAG: double-strand break repair protein AddB [Pseudomonadota bacterium]
MIEPGVYGAPPGADFPAGLVRALTEWSAERSPAALARITVYVNTRRMQRRVRTLFDKGPALLLPRVRLVTELDRDPAVSGLPPTPAPLQRKLDLVHLIKALITAAPDIAPESAAFDLADSLAALLDEMQVEGVSPAAIEHLDVSDQSGHWARAQKFLSLATDFLAGDAHRLDPGARLRLATERVIAHWSANPLKAPVILAGSTGSRGTTGMLMEAVARLPNGVVILPGFDFDMPSSIWETLRTDPTTEDHPQYRFARFLDQLNMDPRDVQPWPGADTPDPTRNRLISLSLRPAPVTDQWLRDGPALGDLREATRNVTLIEAPSPRNEALTIALILRGAAEDGRRAALVSPDRMLTRRVAALLDRWDIEADDSAGRPLALSAPGRLLLQISTLFQREITAAEFVSLLKHPLCHSEKDRNRHLLCTRELELALRRDARALVSAEALAGFKTVQDPDGTWVTWATELLPEIVHDPMDLHNRATTLLELAELCAAGSTAGEATELWRKDAGRKSRAVMETLRNTDAVRTRVTALEFDHLLRSLLDAEEVRDRDKPHPSIMIWGTLEARVQGADLVVLGGLNEGSWPEPPAPDPWLNRAMRRNAGLLLPERRIGLAAHDYQQAAAAPEIVLSRAIRAEDGERLPSRWVNRLINLLEGLASARGPGALAAMRERGMVWSQHAARLETPGNVISPETRPAPRPPLEARPRSLYVTAIQRLIRDPYAVYARYVLGLRKLDPLAPAPDAPLRGQIIHDILDTYMRQVQIHPEVCGTAALLSVADQVLARDAPWALARQLWRARICRFADWFVEDEARRAGSTFLSAEVDGKIDLPEAGFTLRAKADRVDRVANGGLAVIDYKTGAPPSAKEIEHFDKQLLLEALIADAGGFDDIPAAPVDHVAHIGLGLEPRYIEHALSDEGGHNFALPTVRASLVRLLMAYSDRSRGYAARPAMQKVRFEGDYDHLARFGEWDETQPPTPGDVG